MSGRDRGKYLFRIARLVQERARELAVAESLDNGKPIKESRDVDVPLVAAWFFYYAGWADKLDYAGLGANPRALGVAGQVIPWNFPLLMLAWKIAPALAAGNTVVLKPAETTPLSALIFAEILQQADLPAGRREHRDRRRSDRRGAGRATPTSTRSPSPARPASAATIAKAVAGTGKKLTLELGGKAANIVFDDAPIDQADRGHRQRHLLQPGARLLRRQSPARAGVDPRRGRRPAQGRACRHCAWATRSTRTPTSARSTRARSSTASASSADIGEEEGAERWTADCVIPEEGFWFAPTIFTNVQASHRIARDEIFGPVLSVLTFRTPAEAIAKANNTPYGLSAGIWTDKGSRILAVADRLRAGVIWANTFNRFDPASPFGGYKESGYGREGGRHGLARTRRARACLGRALRRGHASGPALEPRTHETSELDACPRRTSSTSAGSSRAASRAARTRCSTAKGEFLANAAQASRKDARDAVVAARGAVKGWSGATAYNRGQVLYRVAELLEGRRAQFVDEIVRAEGVQRGRGIRQVDEAIDRWVWYAGWCDKYAQVAGNANPVAGPYFNISVPEPTGVVAVDRAAGLRAAGPRLGRRAGARRRQHGRRGRVSERLPAVGDQSRRGARDLATCRAES